MKKNQNKQLKSPTKSNKAKSVTKVGAAPEEQAGDAPTALATLHYDNEKTNVGDSPLNINAKMSRNFVDGEAGNSNSMNVTSDNIQMT